VSFGLEEGIQKSWGVKVKNFPLRRLKLGEMKGNSVKAGPGKGGERKKTKRYQLQGKKV